jgi:threonine/homoserine/homoserine lactone efflux protein
VDGRFLTYLVVLAVLIVTPGPDMALVARNAFRGGYPAARATAFGVGAGIFVWGAVTAAGLASALAASAGLFAALKLAGGVFLLGLGVRSLVGAVRPRRHAAAGTPAAPRGAGPSGAGAFAQGFFGNLLNPKAGAIFVAVVPQFTTPGDPFGRLAAMSAAFVVMVTIWLNVYGLGMARTSARFGAGIRRVLDAAAGVVMIALGGRLALERR